MQRQTSIRSYTSMMVVVVALLSTTSALAGICRPQKIYRGFEVPYQARLKDLPKEVTDELLKQREDALLAQIGKYPGHELFPMAYAKELAAQKFPLSMNARVRWLDCLRQYIEIDSDKDGIGDWLALVDGRPSRVLVPLDQDFDNDGIPNIHDPQPFVKNSSPDRQTASSNEHPDEIAHHLWLEPDPGHVKNLLQKDLYARFQILAINQTDSHSEFVLKTVIEFFESIPESFIRSVKQLRYIYAYASHLRASNISASYFPTTLSMSIGGESYYGKNSPVADKGILLRRISHEFGHAILFSRLTPKELAQLAHIYGNWPAMSLPPESFYEPAFFKKFGSDTVAALAPTQYAHENIHEWFAESFSAYWMTKSGGAKVPSMQVQPSKESPSDMLAASFNQWFEELIHQPGNLSTSP